MKAYSCKYTLDTFSFACYSAFSYSVKMSMSLYIKSLFWQFLFGIDTIIALIAYIFLGALFGIKLSLFSVIPALIFAYFPDFDLVFFFLLRRKFKLDSHWKIGHHPILFIPMVGIVVFLFASVLHLSNVSFWVTLSIVCITGHFIHDSVSPIGLHWFSPFSWKRFTFQSGWPVVANPIVWEQYRMRLAGNLQQGVGAEISPRLEKISRVQIVVSLITIFVFIFLILS